MNPFKVKILGIIIITLVSFIQVAILLLGLSFLAPLISTRLLFLIDLAFPIVLIFSIWQSQTVGNLVTIPQLFQWHKDRFLASTTVIISSITLLSSLVCLLILMVVSHFDGISILYWFSNGNLVPIILIFATGALGLHEVFSKRFGSPLAYFILKQFRK